MAALGVVARVGIELPRYTKLHSTLVTQAVGVRWKGRRKQLPKASFSAAFSQVQRLMRVFQGALPPRTT
jgi:hypothetical protein